MTMISKIENTDAEAVKKAFKELLTSYFTPAFGSISKRDFDILLFMKLQEMEVIDPNPELFEIVSELKVTRAKARNLLYEAKLRTSTPNQLDQKLKELLLNPIFIKDNDKIGMEIENPLLIDYLKAKLKKLNYITDGSFSPELVKLTTTAYLALFESYLPDNSTEKIKGVFIEMGLENDTSFKGIMKGVLKKLGTKLADEAGGKLFESFSAYLEPIINGKTSLIQTKFSPLFDKTADANLNQNIV